MPRSAARPQDDGETVGIEADDRTGTVIIPNVGDFVQIDNSVRGEPISFDGRVRSRLFRYIRTNSEVFCAINIVVEETDDDWGKLVKE